MATPYSHVFFPPVPALEIRFVEPSTGKRTQLLHAPIDTGSDSTVAPLALLRQLGANPTRREQVRGLWGGTQRVRLYKVDLLVSHIHIPDLEVVASNDVDLLLGRDVVNQLRLLLDGPAETVELLG
jgi:hypothetical protein